MLSKCKLKETNKKTHTEIVKGMHLKYFIDNASFLLATSNLLGILILNSRRVA